MQVDTGSRVHNVYVTPGGEYLVAGTFGGEANLAVYETASEDLAFGLYPPRDDTALEGVRPMAFDTHEDGSTRHMFVQIPDFHGFKVVDFASREEIASIELPSIPGEQRDLGPFTRPAP